MIRGLIKVAKYRFSNESFTHYGEKPYEDIPLIKELRKLHSMANGKQKLTGRVSNEEKVLL